MTEENKQQGTWQVDPQKYKEAADALFHREPQLTPRLDKWAEDMPGIRDAQFAEPRLIRVNEINDTWMEIPRYENVMWGGGWIGIFVNIITVIAFASVFFWPNIFSRIFFHQPVFFIAYCSLFFVLCSFGFFQLKIVLFSPRGAPVRFNRARQKIYIYEYKRRWNPWVRWPTTIKVFDWADIHGEMTREVDRYDQGYRLYGAVCYPGTNQVRERFVLSYTVGHLELLHGLWSHCCQYMQGKKVSPYPRVTEPPKTWAIRETVCWPEEADRESRSAPDALEGER